LTGPSGLTANANKHVNFFFFFPDSFCQMNSDPEKFLRASLDENSDEDQFEKNMADLETILAASRSASNKRNCSKK